MDKRLMNVSEAAKYLGTTPGSLYQKVHNRSIAFVKDGRSVRFDRLRLDKMIEKQTQEPHGARL
jgi:excisionase family DNA binding protein